MEVRKKFPIGADCFPSELALIEKGGKTETGGVDSPDVVNPFSLKTDDHEIIF